MSLRYDLLAFIIVSSSTIGCAQPIASQPEEVECPPAAATALDALPAPLSERDIAGRWVATDTNVDFVFLEDGRFFSTWIASHLEAGQSCGLSERRGSGGWYVTNHQLGLVYRVTDEGSGPIGTLTVAVKGRLARPLSGRPN
jgi:hypothetical protein